MLFFNLLCVLILPLLVAARVVVQGFNYDKGTFTIAWHAASDAPPSFDMYLRHGADRALLVSGIDSSLGTYTFTLPSNVPPRDGYKVQFVVHDSNPPDILDTSSAFSVRQGDFSGSASTSGTNTNTAASSSVTGVVGSASSALSSASAAISSASSGLSSASSAMESSLSAASSSLSAAISSATASLTGSITTTYTSGSSTITTVLNQASATASVISSSFAATTSSAANGAALLSISWGGLVVPVIGAFLGAALIL